MNWKSSSLPFISILRGKTHLEFVFVAVIFLINNKFASYQVTGGQVPQSMILIRIVLDWALASNFDGEMSELPIHCRQSWGNFLVAGWRNNIGIYQTLHLLRYKPDMMMGGFRFLPNPEISRCMFLTSLAEQKKFFFVMEYFPFHTTRIIRIPLSRAKEIFTKITNGNVYCDRKYEYLKITFWNV